MKLRILTFLLVCWVTSLGFATEVEISGTVTFGPDDLAQPAEGYPVNLYSPIPGPDGVIIEATTLTDENGQYLFTVDLEPNALGFIPVIVEVFDFCNGDVHTLEIVVEPDNQGPFEGLDFHVCSDFNPPPPPMGCDAFFFYEQIDIDPYLVQFFDLSYSDIDALTWSWAFGDGTTSAEQNPLHEYAESGTYDVVLTIESDSCSSTYVFPVEVLDDLGCVCDDVFDPVCVQMASGEVLVFPNACFATCEGFGPDAFVDCDSTGGCFCPEYWDPVCVIGPNGDTIQFSNECFAACDGFGPDAFIDCNIDDCGCDAYFGPPVCVVLDDGTAIHFINACYAECAGYGPDQYYYCDGTGGCFANFQVIYSDDPNDLTIHFEDMSFSSEGTIVSWEWDFGDGNTSLEENPVHEYAAPGVYDVILTITTDTGCTSTTIQHICVGIIDDCICPDIFDPVCVQLGFGTIFFPNLCEAECAGFSAADLVDCEGDPCDCPEYFDPVCVIDPAGNIIQFDNICFALCEGYGPDSFVDCEDGCNCFLIYDPVCVVTANGDFIEFTNECFAECEGYGPDSFVDCVGGPGDGCYALFFLEGDVFSGLIIQFVDASESYEGEIESWLWEFGDGTISEEQNPVHEYLAEGIYEIVLTITTSEGCTSTFVQHLCIGGGDVFGGPECQAMFFFEQDPDDLTSFTFLDMSIGEPSSWTWDFGDGTSSNEQNPVHAYENPGVYLVTLTISTGDCESSVTMLVFSNDDIWYENQCVALFLPLIIPDSNQVFFLNLSSPDAISFEWDFGDGTTSNEYITIHQYADGGTYEASLTITTADGCTNTFSVTIDLEGEDFTGTPSYLTLTSTDQLESIGAVHLYPNPAIDDLIIGFEAETAQDYRLEVLNTKGQVLQRHQFKSNAGSNLEELDVSGLTSGLYLVRISTESATKTMKFVKH